MQKISTGFAQKNQKFRARVCEIAKNDSFFAKNDLPLRFFCLIMKGKTTPLRPQRRGKDGT